MWKPIFGSGKAVVLDIIFFVAKCITDIESKGVYAEFLTKKQHYWKKIVTGGLIDTNFEDNEVCDVGMAETRSEDNNLFDFVLWKRRIIWWR